MVKIAINGFGRIGRLALRRILSHHPDIQVLAINDLADLKTIAYLLKHDSVYGDFEKEISYSLAVLGGAVEVPTVNGMVKLKVRPGTQSGTTVRLRGQGVPHPQSYNKGDQYVVFKINTPSRVSSKAKRILEELETEI